MILMKIKFSKYQGCGNDFIIINNLDNSIKLCKNQIKNLCDRHYGIGADGLILAERHDGDYYMNYYNSDGSLAEMCGNGMRCTAHFISENTETEDQFIINSLSGRHKITLGKMINVSLPRESYDYKEIGLKSKNLSSQFKENNKLYSINYVSMGNPHGVIVLNNLNEISDKTIEELTQNNNLLNGTNINLVKVIDKNNIEVRTCERGDGFTLACGTGACASAVITNKIGLTSKIINVLTPGGCLTVDLTGNEILLSGPVKKVFNGEVDI